MMINFFLLFSLPARSVFMFLSQQMKIAQKLIPKNLSRLLFSLVQKLSRALTFLIIRWQCNKSSVFVNGKKFFQLERIGKLCNLDKRLFICKWRSKFNGIVSSNRTLNEMFFSGSKHIWACKISNNNWRISGQLCHTVISFPVLCLFNAPPWCPNLKYFSKQKKMTDIAQEIREIFCLRPLFVFWIVCCLRAWCVTCCFPDDENYHRWLSFVWWWHKITWMNKYL